MQVNVVDEFDKHLNRWTLSRSVVFVPPTYVPPFSQMPDVVEQTLFTVPFLRRRADVVFIIRRERTLTASRSRESRGTVAIVFLIIVQTQTGTIVSAGHRSTDA